MWLRTDWSPTRDRIQSHSSQRRSTPGARFVDDWQQDNPPYRVVIDADRTVIDHKVKVSSSAVQWADGLIDDGRIEPPHVDVSDPGDNGLTSTQARELAAELLEAADEIDGWVTR